VVGLRKLVLIIALLVIGVSYSYYDSQYGIQDVVGDTGFVQESVPVKEQHIINTSLLEEQVFLYVNLERTGRGLEPLTLDDKVSDVARLHSKDMADKSYFSHVDSEGERHVHRLRKSGLLFYGISSENIGMGRFPQYFDTPEKLGREIVDVWMQSEGHKVNILNDKFIETGIGIVVSPDNRTYYFTQIFLSNSPAIG